MSHAVAIPGAPAHGGVPNSSRVGLEPGTNNSRGERKAGKGRRRRQAAEQRRIEQQRWGQYVEDEDEDFSVVAPSPPNSRRRARRSMRRNSARDDLEEYMNGLASDDHATGLNDDLDLDVALALSFSIAEQNAIAYVAQIGTSHVPVIADMTYESLMQLENVRCVASATIVASLPVTCFEKEQVVGFDQVAEVCVICQGDYEHGDSQIKLPCQHAFHQNCGAEWLLNYSKICPVCKHDVTDVATVSASSV